jgi:hypothetical protein
VEGIKEIFKGQLRLALMKMKDEIKVNLRKASNRAAFNSDGGVINRAYWQAVKERLLVHLVAKIDLSEIHSKKDLSKDDPGYRDGSEMLSKSELVIRQSPRSPFMNA